MKHSDLLYLPTYETPPFKEGSYSLFDGIPCPTVDAYELLGTEGVNLVHERFAELLSYAKVLHGAFDEKRFAFARYQAMVDLRTNTPFRIGETINEKVAANKTRKILKEPDLPFPDLVVDPVLKQNSYENLLVQNHYIIGSFPQLPEYIIEYGVKDFFDIQLFQLKIYMKRFREAFIKEHGTKPKK